MPRISVRGSDGRFGKIIKKFKDRRFIFRNKKELNILSNKSIKNNQENHLIFSIIKYMT